MSGAHGFGEAPRPLTRQRGVALVFVLWAGLLIAALALASSVTARSTAAMATAAAERLQADALAAAGVHAGIAELLTPGDRDSGYFARTVEFSLAGGEVQVTVTPEHGLIDLNRADEALIEGIAALVTGGDGEALAEALLARRPVGTATAEAAAQFDELPPVVFLAPRELLALPGVDAARYARLRAATSVYNGQPGVDPLSAPRDVLLALPGASTETVDQFLEERAQRVEEGSAGAAVAVLRRARSVFPGAVRLLLTRRPSVYSVVSGARLPSGARARVYAVVALRAADGRRHSVLAWNSIGWPAVERATGDEP